MRLSPWLAGSTPVGDTMRYRPRCSHCRHVVHTHSASLSRTATDPHLRSHLKGKANEEPSERLGIGHGLKRHEVALHGGNKVMAEERERGRQRQWPYIQA